MSEEIKDIILDVKDSLNETPKNMYKYNEITLNLNEFEEILNYIEQLENIRKKAIKYIKNNKETREHYEPYGTPMGNSNYATTHIFGYYELLDILNKGE